MSASESRTRTEDTSMRDFTVVDQAGNAWSLANALKDGAVVLVLYRGDW